VSRFEARLYRRFAYFQYVHKILHSYHRPMSERVWQSFDILLYQVMVSVRLFATAYSVKFDSVAYLQLDWTMALILRHHPYDAEMIATIAITPVFGLFLYHQVWFRLSAEL